MAYKIVLSGLGGTLDVRMVDEEDDIRAAVLDIAAGCIMQAGDTIRIIEVDD